MYIIASRNSLVGVVTCVYSIACNMLQEYDWVYILPVVSSCILEGNHNLVTLSTLSCHIYEGDTDQNAPLSDKYTVDYLHISPNCHYILSSISESHVSPKTTFTALK